MPKTRLASRLESIEQRYASFRSFKEHSSLKDLQEVLTNRGYSHTKRMEKARALIVKSRENLDPTQMSYALDLLSSYESSVITSKYEIKGKDEIASSAFALQERVYNNYVSLENTTKGRVSPQRHSGASSTTIPSNKGSSSISINPYLVESIQQDTQSEEPNLAVPAEMRRRTWHSHSKRIRKTPSEGADLNSVQLSYSSDILSFYESNFSSSRHDVTIKNATFSSLDLQERVYNDNVSLENTLAEQTSSGVSSLTSARSSPSASVPSVPTSPSPVAGVIDLSEDSPPPISITPYLPESTNRRRTGLIRKEIIAGLVCLAIGASVGALGGYRLGSWVRSSAEYDRGLEKGRIERQNDEYLYGKDIGIAEGEKKARDQIAEEKSALELKLAKENRISSEVAELTSRLDGFSNAFPLVNVQVSDDGSTKISGQTSYSRITFVDTPVELAKLADAVAASFHPKEVDANAFENLGLSRTAMGEIRKYAPEESLDEFGMVVSGLSSGRGYVPYENNSKGVSLIGNSQSIEQRLAQAPQNHEKSHDQEVKKKERKKVNFVSRLFGGRVRFVRAR